MGLKFTVTALFSATPEELFNAWLDSSTHSDMTGGKAVVSDTVGEGFSTWNGYISGKNLELEYPTKILQSWRTSEFTEADPDSMLEIRFEKQGDQTQLTINHSVLPEHGMQYKQGWVDSYFTPMKDFFSK
jgi:activator of HSP90 ATPase